MTSHTRTLATKADGTAERLYTAAQAAGHGGEDLAMVVTALDARFGSLP
jgi:hypothetical protein